MALDPSKLDAMIAEIDELPTLPSVVGRLMELLGDPHVQAKVVADAIANDQALTAKVLRVANSAYYGQVHAIGTIQQAVVVLGFATIRSIVVSASVVDAFRGNSIHEGYFNLDEFWAHAVGTAAAASAIAKIAEIPRSEDAFTAGLLHGIGLLVLDQYFPNVMHDLQERVEVEGMCLLEAEEELMGVDHARLGARLLEEWQLPEDIVHAVRYHRDVTNAPGDRRLAAVVQLGDVFCRSLGYGNAGEPTIPEIQQNALDVIGLTHTAFPVMVEPVDQEIERASVFLEMAHNPA